MAKAKKRKPGVLSLGKSKRSSVRTKAGTRGGRVRRGGRAGSKSKPSKRRYSGR